MHSNITPQMKRLIIDTPHEEADESYGRSQENKKDSMYSLSCIFVIPGRAHLKGVCFLMLSVGMSVCPTDSDLINSHSDSRYREFVCVCGSMCMCVCVCVCVSFQVSA